LKLRFLCEFEKKLRFGMDVSYGHPSPGRVVEIEISKYEDLSRIMQGPGEGRDAREASFHYEAG
jgi:hypothetical protein